MKLAEIIINNPDISKRNVPYIIAEAGVNHEGNFQNAIKLIDLAADGGAHAIKFQTYKAETLASKNSPSYWDLNSEKTDSQYKLFKKYDKFWKSEYEKLYLHCLKKNIEFISTPFDLESANFLNDIMTVFKISSSDITNKIFIEHICGFKKPIILSTGASNLDEIKKTVHLIKKRNIPLSLLHCILNYPTLDDNANLGMILELKSEFNECCIGYSDHTLPNMMDNLIYATLLGAKIIEKHFTHNKKLQGNDHYHAMDIVDLKIFNDKIIKLKTIIGSTKKYSLDTEKISRVNARRSLIASKDIKKGEKFSINNLTFKRPGIGISPNEIDNIVGKKSNKNIKFDDIIFQEDVDDSEF